MEELFKELEAPPPATTKAPTASTGLGWANDLAGLSQPQQTAPTFSMQPFGAPAGQFGTPGQQFGQPAAAAGFGGQPGFGVASQPGFGVAGQPGFGAAGQPGFGAAGQPGFGAAGQPGFGAAGQPGFRVAGQPGFGAPIPSAQPQAAVPGFVAQPNPFGVSINTCTTISL